MNIFVLGDLYHQTLKPFPKEINDFLKTINNPKKYVEKLIKDDMEKRCITVTDKETTTEQIKNFIKKNNIITTTIAKEEGFIRQSVELQHAIAMLQKEGMVIGRITGQRPHVYFYGIDRNAAISLTRRDPGGGSYRRGVKGMDGGGW